MTKTDGKVCTDKDCTNVVPQERLDAGYDYCTACSAKHPRVKRKIVLENQDVDELRRAW